MEISRLTVGAFGTNCYIIITKANNAIVIDPGADAAAILKFIEGKNAVIKAILLTHGHLDHTFGVSSLKESSHATVYIHDDDNELMIYPEKSMMIDMFDFSGFIPLSADVLLKDQDKFSIDEVNFTLLHTPGHTKGSSVYQCQDLMFTGDTLFCSGIGRTDLYGGDSSQLRNSLLKLAAIEDDFTVLPGHGETTRLSYEKRTSPYMGTDYDDIF